MPTPIAPWEAQNTSQYPDLVWYATLDGRYQIEVQRTGNRTANLCVFDHQDGDKELACWEVGLSYGAMFGPDVGDVAAWQDKVCEFVDGLSYGEGP